MLISKESKAVKKLLKTAGKPEEQAAIKRKILERAKKIISAALAVNKPHGVLILLEHHTKSMGVVGHSFAHGSEMAALPHYYYMVARIASMENTVAGLIGGYEICVPPMELRYSRPERRDNLLKVRGLDVKYYVDRLYPETQYKPYFSHKETHVIAIGPRAVGSRLQEWKKLFPQITVSIP
ncbi:MAG: hypothetical protein AAB428_00725 [Patescibacteria group bacterium]